ncbi:MAG: hypothetical protein NVS3B14_12710 [Ktedonobacteraceae bacterium]
MPTQTPVNAPLQGLPGASIPMGLGVNVHFAAASDVSLLIEKLADLGFRFARLDLLWDVVESKKGHYDFSNYERIVDALAALRRH